MCRPDAGNVPIIRPTRNSVFYFAKTERAHGSLRCSRRATGRAVCVMICVHLAGTPSRENPCPDPLAEAYGSSYRSRRDGLVLYRFGSGDFARSFAQGGPSDSRSSRVGRTPFTVTYVRRVEEGESPLPS